MLEDQCNIYHASTGGFDAQLFQSSADCIKILDLNGCVIGLNPGGVQALELDAPDVLHGKSWADFWPDDTRAQVLASVTAGIAGERAQFAAFCPTSKGTKRWWDVVVTPIYDEQPKVSRLMVVSRDVTDIHLARTALQDANRRKDEFLALLAHELRNPLSAAGMAATVLQTQSRVLAPERVVEIGKLIERQVGHMSRLAEDLLDVSRVSRGDISLNLQPVDMKDVVRAVLEQLQVSYTAKQQQVSWTACEQACIVLGDQTRLIQVAGNLLANAVRYTPAQGSITLTLTRQDGTVSLSVCDTGVGIAAEHMATLFELYSKVDRAAQHKGGGLGIGLALVRSLIELHGGSVSAASEGQDRGSTFTLQIPIAPDSR
jgi:PAS domain S-box-containing protein